jgi:hypothetical protein
LLSLLLVSGWIVSRRVSAESDRGDRRDNATVGESGEAGLSGKASDSAQGFVMYLNAQRKATCRVATPAERNRIMQRHGDSHVIYAGAPRRDATGAREWILKGAAGAQSLQLQTSAGLQIVLHSTSQLNQNQTAKNAFIAAANHWEGIISTPITVIVDVDFGTSAFGDPFDDDVLGQTGTEEETRPYSEVRERLLANSPTAAEAQLYNALPTGPAVPTQLSSNAFTSLTVRMSRPNARALGLVSDILDPNGVPLGGGDAGIGFNSAFAFDFNPNNGVDFDKVDFDSVATHEIGHAIGFLSESGGVVYAPPSIWDVFRFRPGAASLGTFATAPRIMTSGGTQVYFNGQTNTFGSQELRLSTGGPSGSAGDGNQSSHWKDDDITGQYIGIMDPNIGSGERNPITTNDVNTLDSFGYSVGSPVGPPPAPPPAPPAQPPNDNFANATVVQGTTGAVIGNSSGATKETGEPAMLPGNANGAGGKSVWYSWTSPVTGTAIFDTEGSGYDTMLAVSTGNSVGGLSRLGQNDDISTGQTTASRLTFNVAAGVTYQLTVDGFNNGAGPEFGIIELNWSATGTAPSPSPTPTPTPTPTPPVPAIVFGRAVENVSPLPDVLVGLSENGVMLQQVTTGADGRWSFGAFVGHSYNVLFVRSGYSFNPPSLVFPVNQPAQDMGDVFAVKGNSIDASDFFVTKHYDDFLGRLPDSSGLNFWVSNIEGCAFSLPCREVKRIDTSAAFFLSIEFQETGYLVYRAYKAAYGDALDPTIGSPPGFPVPIIRRSEFLADTPLISQNVQVGVGNWQAQLEANKQAFMLAFVGRSRFTSAYPSTMTADEFVTKLDQCAGGVLSSSEKTTLMGVLGATPADNAKRAQVLRSVAEDSDLNAHETNRAFVLMQYFGYLRRNPNDAPELGLNYGGYKFWLDKLNSFNGDFRAAEMVKSFLVSGEYRSRFGP